MIVTRFLLIWMCGVIIVISVDITNPMLSVIQQLPTKVPGHIQPLTDLGQCLQKSARNGECKSACIYNILYFPTLPV